MFHPKPFSVPHESMSSVYWYITDSHYYCSYLFSSIFLFLLIWWHLGWVPLSVLMVAYSWSRYTTRSSPTKRVAWRAQTTAAKDTTGCWSHLFLTVFFPGEWFINSSFRRWFIFSIWIWLPVLRWIFRWFVQCSKQRSRCLWFWLWCCIIPW